MADALRVAIWRVPTPLPNPVLTPGGPFDTFFHIVVVVEDADGIAGWGYSGLPSSSLLDAAVDHAQRVLAARPVRLDTLLAIEHFDETFTGAPSGTSGKAAANAIALGAWDLAARRAGVACADLWGRRPHTTALDCYASGLFLDAELDDLTREAQAYHDAGFRYVKMRVGHGARDDARRFGAVARVFAEPGSVAVDAFHAWAPRDAAEFVERVATPLLWVEDATSYDLLGEIADIFAPIAAGESLETLGALRALTRSARVDYALLDVQRLGGPMRFLATAHALAAQGLRIGAHIYTSVSAHLLACVDDPLPVEVFDWSDPLFERPPAPAPDGTLAVTGPGFASTLNADTLRRYGTCTILS